MSMEEWIVEGVLGLFILYMGYQIGWKENLRLLHGYHYRNVSDADKKPFARKMGVGNMLVGAGILAMPLGNLAFGHDIGYYAGIVLALVGVCLMIWTVIRYNGTLFAFCRKKS